MVEADCGRNDDGTNQTEPLFAYSEEEIIERTKPPGWITTTNARALQQCAERREALLAEFRREFAKNKAPKDACGYTAALEQAAAAGDYTSTRLAALMEHPFQSVEEVRQAAAQVQIYADDYGTDDPIFDFLHVLAAGGVRS